MLLRLSWISPSDGTPKSFSLLMKLTKVSHFEHGKRCAKTAELLRIFATKYHLEQNQYQSSVVADYQIAGYIKRHLILENLEVLAERLTVCNSHSHQNFFRRLLQLVLEAIQNNDCLCKFWKLFFIENNSYFSSMVFTTWRNKNIQ